MRISDWSSDVCFPISIDHRGAKLCRRRRLRRGKVDRALPTTLPDPIFLGHARGLCGLDGIGLLVGLRAVQEIGRASCRERVCEYVVISGGAVSLKTQNNSEPDDMSPNNSTRSR